MDGVERDLADPTLQGFLKGIERNLRRFGKETVKMIIVHLEAKIQFYTDYSAAVIFKNRYAD